MNNRSIVNIIFLGVFVMKKTYKIDVDCAACADKMEQAASKTEGVISASVSFCQPLKWVLSGGRASG